MWFFTSHLLNKTASDKQLVADYISQIILILDHCLLTIIAFAARLRSTTSTCEVSGAASVCVMSRGCDGQ